jgi:hypothetical protein
MEHISSIYPQTSASGRYRPFLALATAGLLLSACGGGILAGIRIRRQFHQLHHLRRVEEMDDRDVAAQAPAPAMPLPMVPPPSTATRKG